MAGRIKLGVKHKVHKLLTNDEIRQARPNLRLVNPLAFWLCVAMVLLNVSLGYVVIRVPDTSGLVLYNILPQIAYGLLYFLSAGLLSLSLLKNSWYMTKVILAFGLFLKCLYAYGLVALGFKLGFSNLEGIVSVWLFIVFVQALMIMFLLPPWLKLNGGDDGEPK